MGIQFVINVQFSRTEYRRFLFMEDVYRYRENGRCAVDSEWHGPGVIGRFGNKFSSAYYRRGTIETDLNGHRPTSKIFDILDYGGNSHLHFGKYKNLFMISSCFANLCLLSGNSKREFG